MPDFENIIINKIFKLAHLQGRMAAWKSAGEKIVFTNGVFDLLHTGHLTYLAQAAAMGNKLVIGLNSDASVKRIKGEGRPVNNQDSRALLLASLLFVDAVIIFDEDTPAELIKSLLPDILVKGADYDIEQIVGAKEVLANGGKVKTVPLVDGFSSTTIINKIRGRSA